jgi:outer membrane protein OmpA-like peptidoglycan-associated protein
MLNTSRFRLVLAGLATTTVLAGCTTPHAKPPTSQAVLDARAHRDEPGAPRCPSTTLAQVSPLQLGFPFNDATRTESMVEPIAGAARWLVCHPATSVVIKPDSDGHGNAAEQDQLARQRANVARDGLAARGVAADRIRVLARGATDPTGDVFLIRAEGRRW